MTQSNPYWHRGSRMQVGKPNPGRVDMAGQVINSIEVLRYRGNWNARTQWDCKCQHCDAEFIMDGTVLRTGKARCRACAPSRKRKKAE